MIVNHCGAWRRRAVVPCSCWGRDERLKHMLSGWLCYLDSVKSLDVDDTEAAMAATEICVICQVLAFV